MGKEYEYLANSIILQVAEDYREALGLLWCDLKNKEAKIKKRSLERFFRSKWFRILSKTDPENLIGMLRNEFPYTKGSLPGPPL